MCVTCVAVTNLSKDDRTVLDLHIHLKNSIQHVLYLSGFSNNAVTPAQYLLMLYM